MCRAEEKEKITETKKGDPLIKKKKKCERDVAVNTKKNFIPSVGRHLLQMETTERESRVPVCLEVPRDQEQSTASPGGKAKLSGVKGRRRWSGHTRVRALFTTGEPPLFGPPTSAAAAPPLSVWRCLVGVLRI